MRIMCWVDFFSFLFMFTFRLIVTAAIEVFKPLRIAESISPIPKYSTNNYIYQLHLSTSHSTFNIIVLKVG